MEGLQAGAGHGAGELCRGSHGMLLLQGWCEALLEAV